MREVQEIDAIESQVAKRIREQRQKRNLTIDQLASASGVSRAMISRIERQEVSPTALLLGRLTNALGMTMSALFRDDIDSGPLVLASRRPVWRDSATGYTRRNVLPDGAPLEIVDVVMPPGRSVTYENIIPLAIEQYVWVMSGALDMTVDGVVTRLEAGDCLAMRLDQHIRYLNPLAVETRYSVILLTGGRRVQGQLS
jgi:transcriptional regulator with XRE-family HTH domain